MCRPLLAFLLGFFPQYPADLITSSFVALVRQPAGGGGGS